MTSSRTKPQELGWGECVNCQTNILIIHIYLYTHILIEQLFNLYINIFIYIFVLFLKLFIYIEIFICTYIVKIHILYVHILLK